MNIVVRTILMSMLLLASPLRDVLADVGCAASGVRATMHDKAVTPAEIVADHTADEAGGLGGGETIDAPEEADEAVIERDRQASWAGLGLPACSIQDSGPQCATAQATRPPNSI